MPTIEQSEKANEKQRKRKESPEIFVERVHKDEKRTRIDYPNVQPKVLYVFFLQSLVPRLIWSLQIMRIPRFYHIYCQWKKKTRSGPQYVHFNKAKKDMVLLPEIDRVKKFLSPTRLHK